MARATSLMSVKVMQMRRNKDYIGITLSFMLIRLPHTNAETY